MSDNAIELSDFIESLRGELIAAMERGAGQDLRFVADKVELELKVAAETGEKADGKVGFKVFGIGADVGATGSQSSSVIQTVKLTLSLVDKNGKSALISAQSGNQTL